LIISPHAPGIDGTNIMLVNIGYRYVVAITIYVCFVPCFSLFHPPLPSLFSFSSSVLPIIHFSPLHFPLSLSLFLLLLFLVLLSPFSLSSSLSLSFFSPLFSFPSLYLSLSSHCPSFPFSLSPFPSFFTSTW
jgi:hypothetical protein